MEQPRESRVQIIRNKFLHVFAMTNIERALKTIISNNSLATGRYQLGKVAIRQEHHKQIGDRTYRERRVVVARRFDRQARLGMLSLKPVLRQILRRPGIEGEPGWAPV